jgi:hypothetical protein
LISAELEVELPDTRLHVRERLRLVDVGLDLRQQVAGPHDRALAHRKRQDPARHDGLDVDLRHRVDDADLADRDLEVLGLDLAQPEGGAFDLGIALVLALGRHQGHPSQGQDDRQDRDPLLLFHEKPP